MAISGLSVCSMRASHNGGLGLWGPLGIHAHIRGFYGDFRGAVLPSNYVASLSLCKV